MELLNKLRKQFLKDARKKFPANFLEAVSPVAQMSKIEDNVPLRLAFWYHPYEVLGGISKEVPETIPKKVPGEIPDEVRGAILKRISEMKFLKQYRKKFLEDSRKRIS